MGLACRKHSKTTRLGRYGIGAKHALLWIAHDLNCSLKIESLCKGRTFSCESTFRQIGTVRKLSVKETPANCDSRPGTRVCLSGVKRPQLPTAKDDVSRLCSELGFVYSKALEDGKNIVIETITRRGSERHAIAPHVPPPFEKEIRDEFWLDKKRGVRLHVGLVSGSEAVDRPALHYRYAGRVIEASSGKGCGGYGTNRIFGYVDLIGPGWKLATLKDAVYAPAQLYSEILKRSEPILKEAQKQHLVAESAALKATVEEKVNDAIKAKAVRGKRKKRGTASATGGGGRHKTAKRKQRGATFDDIIGASGGAGVTIDFTDLKNDAIGRFSGNTIELNTAVYAVREARNENNAATLFSIAMFVYYLKHSEGSFDHQFAENVLTNVGRTLAEDSKLSGRHLFEKTRDAAA